MTRAGDSENEISVAVRGRCGGEMAFRHAHGYLYFWALQAVRQSNQDLVHLIGIRHLRAS